MRYVQYGGIPLRGLPLRGWPKYGIPGFEIPPVIPDQPIKDIQSTQDAYFVDYLKREQREQQDGELFHIIEIIMRSGILN